MFAGKSTYPVGTLVEVCNITDPLDADLNGRRGTLAHPFLNFPIQDVGILLETDKPGILQPVTVHLHEFKVIE